MSPKKILITVSILLFIYFLYSTIKVFPKMFDLVDNLSKMEENQEITDTIFLLKNKNNEIIELYFNKKTDSVKLIFIPSERQFTKKLVEEIKNSYNNSSYVITFSSAKNLLDNTPFPVYSTDTINLPLKYKKIRIPYEIQFRKDTIFKAKFL